MTHGTATLRGLAQPMSPLVKPALFVIVAALAGCAGIDKNVARESEDVSTVTVGDPGEVSAMVLARAMLRAGFNRAEILERGPKIRRGLAVSGGAEARSNGQVLALFSHKEGVLYVTSASSGTFSMKL